MAKLITALDCINTAFLHTNIDPSLIKDSYIEVSQEEHIRPILTQDLYDLIVSESAAGVYTGLNETLLNDYIKPALAFYVALDIVPHLAIRMNNKGLMINSSENSNPASREERTDIMNRFREQGKTMIDKMERYLYDNSSSFATYQNGSSATITTNLKGGFIL